MRAVSARNGSRGQRRSRPRSGGHMRITTLRAGALLGSGVVSTALVLASSATANASTGHDDHGGSSVAVTRTNLISDQVGHAPLIDPNLVNPWGMSFGTGATPTPVWVSDNGADVSTLYNRS